ncbi:MAG: hypothetical protein QXP04_05105, partial [Candidatus Nanoarchaeia archaeon]|nr:hypothetical protein [Candidatus Jingweiarchaeum tengchongense]
MFCDFRICFSEEIDEVRKLLQKFGFDGACIIMEDLSSYEKTKKKILDININNFKFLFGLELSSGKIDLLKNRKEFDYFVFRDPSYNIARMLVNKKKVDCIYFSKKFYFNDILAKKMKQNKIALEFCFNDVLNADGKERSVILWNMIVAAKI